MGLMADDSLTSLQPGTVIAGRYEVVKCLGAGSMGLVYACRHRELPGHMVAVKVLFPEVAQDKVAAARFRNEIFASYGVSHPNVVRAYEYLRDGDLVAYTMEFVGGGDLADRLGKANQKIAIPEIINLLAQKCAGVQAIHDAGIVHRDLKPENILLTEDNQVKIADFGIARTGTGSRLTEHGGVVGTIDYVSPEYIMQGTCDWRSDIYALGILGYEMVTGESPFRGDSVYATVTKRLKTDPRTPSDLRPDSPRELDPIILRAMARDPETRYQSAAEMFYDLQTLMPKGEGQRASTHLQVRRTAPSSFVGPTYQPAPGEKLPPLVDESDLQSMEAPAPQSASREFTMPQGVSSPNVEVKSSLSLSPAPGGAGTAPLGRLVRPPSTDAFNPRILGAVTGREATVHDPRKLNPIVSGTKEAQGNRSTSRTNAVSVTSGSLDAQRIRALSGLVENINRSLWVDVVTGVVAVLIGLGLGFAVVRFLRADGITVEHPYRMEGVSEIR